MHLTVNWYVPTHALHSQTKVCNKVEFFLLQAKFYCRLPGCAWPNTWGLWKFSFPDTQKCHAGLKLNKGYSGPTACRVKLQQLVQAIVQGLSWSVLLRILQG